jgi:hypothetical protein
MTGRSARLIGVRRLEFFHASKEGALVLFDALVAPLLAAPLDGTERALVAERLAPLMNLDVSADPVRLDKT